MNSPTHSVKSYSEFLEILREHEIATSTKYVLVSGVKRFQQKEVAVGDNQRIHWMENIPYFYCASRLFACHQGKDRNLGKKKKYANERNLKASKNKSVKPFKGHRETKKINCPAMIRVRRVVKVMIRHPEYPSLERDPNKHMKRVYSQLIRERLSKGKLLCEELYLFNLPKPEDHLYHYVGEEAVAKAMSAVRSTKKSTTYCCICKASRGPKAISFHRVPKSEPLLSEWRRVIGKNVKSNLHRVCSQHFPPSQFKSNIMDNGKIRKVLLPNSIPRVDKYPEAQDVIEFEEAMTSDNQPVETEPQSVVPLEHLYCALETGEPTFEEGELCYEEVEVELQDFQITYVDDLNTDTIRQSLPMNVEEDASEYLGESNLENTEESIEEIVLESEATTDTDNFGVVNYFEVRFPENTEELQPGCNEEYIQENTEELQPGSNEEYIQENTEESEYTETLEENDIHEEHFAVESQKHKRRKLLQTDENYQLVGNDSILIHNQIDSTTQPIIVLRQPLNQVQENEHLIETNSVLGEPKKKVRNDEDELTEDCFTSPKHFQAYKRHKKRLKTDVTVLKSELLELQSKYAQLSSFVSRVTEQGFVDDLPQKHLTPLMCNIVDRALFENKLKVTPELKNFSTSLLTQSPDCYQFVKSQLMNVLPEEKTVKWWLSRDRLQKKPRIFVVRKESPKIV